MSIIHRITMSQPNRTASRSQRTEDVLAWRKIAAEDEDDEESARGENEEGVQRVFTRGEE